MRQRWKSGCVVVVAGCLIAILVLALGGVAVQRQVIPPPEANICLGSACLVAHTVRIPACPPLIPCRIVPGLIPAQDRYTVVLIDKRGQPGSQNSKVLLTLPLKR
jgi:hypothetical protein